MLVIWTVAERLHVDKLFKPLLTGSGVPHRFTTAETIETVEAEPGDVILCMGTTLLNSLQAGGHLPKGRTVTSQRGRIHTICELPVIITYDPALLAVDPTKTQELQWDINLAKRLHQSGSLEPPIGVYTYVGDFSAELEKIEHHWASTGKAMQASLDLETIGLDEFAPEARIVTVSVTLDEGKSSVFVMPENPFDVELVIDQIRYICTTPKIKMTGANLKFDMRWIKRHLKFWITNQTFDTTLVGSMLDENRSNSLNLHAKVYTDMGGYDDTFNGKHDKARMDMALFYDPEGFLTYAGGDTDACYRVTNKMRPELVADKRLANFYVKLLQPASKAFAVMEHRGVVVDIQRFESLKLEVQESIRDTEAQIFKLFPPRLKNKHRGALSLSRAKVIQDFMFSPQGLGLTPNKDMLTEKTGVPSVKLEHLEMFGDVPEASEFVRLMKEYNSATKTLSTFIVGFMSHIRSDGRFHPAYSMFRGDPHGAGDSGGTVTGRTSCTAPAWQTVPQHTIWAKPLRSVYVPPPGMAIMKFDYSQGELRVAACVANEETMLETYRAGLDLHLRTGARVYGMDFETALALKAAGDPMVKAIRQGGKAGNFGLIYGMGDFGFQHYARKSYGVEMTMEQVENFTRGFFEEYPRLVTWHKNAIKTAQTNLCIRSPLGRVRHLPLINARNQEVASSNRRQAINSPIQCTLSDLGLYSAAILMERYPELWVFGFTHDDLSFYVPEDKIPLWYYRIKDVMENLPLKENFGWDHQIPFLIDSAVSTVNLAECQEYAGGTI